MNINLHPLEKLLIEEDPLEVTRHLDDMLSILVQYNESQGHLADLGDRYHMIRILRNAFSQTAKSPYYGNH